MGWAVRLKFLFTTNSHGVNTTPNYIPGYGFHDTMNWGFNYYLGYTFSSQKVIIPELLNIICYLPQKNLQMSDFFCNFVGF